MLLSCGLLIAGAKHEVALAAPKAPFVIPNAVRNQVGREEAVLQY
jgi:hypothetical protein